MIRRPNAIPGPPDRRPSRYLPVSVPVAVLLLLGLQGSGARLVEAAAEPPARQVTIFGVIATPGSNAVDPKLAEVLPKLRELLPGHGFRLVDIQSKRLTPGHTVGVNFRNGMVAQTELSRTLDENGKVQLRLGLFLNGETQLLTQVATPPNQLFFYEREIAGGERLLVGIGAR